MKLTALTAYSATKVLVREADSVHSQKSRRLYNATQFSFASLIISDEILPRKLLTSKYFNVQHTLGSYAIMQLTQTLE